MTGLDPEHDRVCEVAIVTGRAGKVEERWSTLVRPPVPVGSGARKVHGLTDERLATEPVFAEVAEEVARRLEGRVFVAHNVPFDVGFLHREMDEAGVAWAPPATLDTLELARRLFAFRRNNLRAVARALGVPLERAHRALDDAMATFGVVGRMFDALDPAHEVRYGELRELLAALAPNSPLRLAQKRLLLSAFAARTTVWLDYQSTGDPLRGLVHREVGIWAMELPYFQGWCYLREGERVFRLDRVRRVEHGDRPYDIPAFTPRIRR